MRVIADCREPAEILASLREAAAAAARAGTADGSAAVEVEVEALDVGDYLVGPGAAVERKTGADFVASILDGRFAEQAAKLRASYEKVFWLFGMGLTIALPLLLLLRRARGPGGGGMAH